jgi:DNA-binding PadR family transcriptional regulator
MSNGKMNLRYFVLGLLAQQPMSGYDIKRFLKGLSWLIGSPSSGSLYPLLRALLEDQLVTVEIVPGVDKPPRKIYSISESGREALQTWLEQPSVPNTPLKAFAMRLFLADNFPPTSLKAHLRQRRSQVAAHQAELANMIKHMDGGSDMGLLLAMEYGSALAEAELNWLDTTLGKMSQQSSRNGE